MKKLSFAIVLLLVSINVHAQFSGGLKINLGSGGIHSSNLEENLNYQDVTDSKITAWTVDQRWKFGFGIGGFVAYRFSDRFTFLAEPTVNIFKCGIDITREENNIDSNGDGDIKFETTESEIDHTYLYLPFLARFEFASKFYLLGGLGIHFAGSPDIASTATSQKDDYKNGILDKTTIDPKGYLETDLNVFDSPRYDFVLGLGKAFDMNGKELYIDVRYNLPLSKSEMFTTDPRYNDGLFKHNDLLSLKGKTDAEGNAPFLLNDFKMSMVSLTIGIALF